MREWRHRRAPAGMMTPATHPGVEVRRVSSRRDWRSFLDLPARLHRDDTCWIRPLDVQVRQTWSPRNPWFAHAQAQAWLAWRGSRPVGSISAQMDELHRQHWGEAVGYFGQLCAEDDAEVVAALFGEARRWLRERGCTQMRGPFDLGVNQSCGLLVDGFDTPPMIMMNHSAPWLGARVEAAGLQPAMDLLAYIVAPDFAAPPAMQRLVERAGERLRIRPLDRARYWQELELLRELFNDAWAENWGFVPFTPDEFRELGRELKLLVGPEAVFIAELDGEPAGFILAMPNVNELIADLDGRLLPFGWLRLLWRLKTGRATTARVPLMGVRRRFHGRPLGAMLAFGLIEAVRRPLIRAGIREVELSWILETNQGMRSLIESIGGRAYKRYRIYQAELDDGR
jgi:GNAT superfamily N-acetyltransferase